MNSTDTSKVEGVFVKVQEESTKIRNIQVEGVDILRMDKVNEVIEVTREVHPKTQRPIREVSKKVIKETVEPLSYPLREVSADEMKVIRKRKVPSFVLKFNGRLYYTQIPDNVGGFLTAKIFGKHRCAYEQTICSRLSPANDEAGGCAKVREGCWGIERYPFITIGYETFNTKQDVFIVVKCLHHERYERNRQITSVDANQAKLALAQFVWEDVNTLREVRVRSAKNGVFSRMPI